MPIYYSLPGPSVLPKRLASTTLELLKDPFAFTQRALLNPEQFVRESKRRGIIVTVEELELLHRRRILQPFYEVHRRPVANPCDIDGPREILSSAVVEVVVALRQGRLSDPAQRRYSKWPGRGSNRSLWFSWHQLLLVRFLPYWQTRMEVREMSGGRELTMNLAEGYLIDRFARERSLAMVLEIFTPVYLPRVTGVVRSASGSDWSELLSSAACHPASSLAVAGCDPESLVHQADVLLANAKEIDPLGKWSRVTRIGNPRRWDDLRYDAC